MNLNIIGKRKIFFTISIVAMVLVLLVTIFVGPTLDIEFKGGSIATYSYTGEMDPAAFEKTVEQGAGTVCHRSAAGKQLHRSNQPGCQPDPVEWSDHREPDRAAQDLAGNLS